MGLSAMKCSAQGHSELVSEPEPEPSPTHRLVGVGGGAGERGCNRLPCHCSDYSRDIPQDAAFLETNRWT